MTASLKDFRPSLIPESVRPLVLAPLYLVRKFVQIIFKIVQVAIIIMIILVGTAPVFADIRLLFKILLTAFFCGGFVSALFKLRAVEKELMDLLDKAEKVASGDLIAFALLAAELTKRSLKKAGGKTKELVDKVLDVEMYKDVAGKAAAAVSGAATAAGKHASQAAHMASDSATAAARATSDVARKSATKVADTSGAMARGSVKVAGQVGHASVDAATETTALIGKGAKGAWVAAQNTSVKVGKGSVRGLGKSVVKNVNSAAKTTVKTTTTVVHTATDADTYKKAGKTVVATSTTATKSVAKAGTAAGHVVVDGTTVVAKTAVKTGTATGTFVVHTGSAAVHLTADATMAAYNTTKDAAEVAYSMVEGAATAALDVLQRLMQMNPMYMFKEVVRICVKVLTYIVFLTPPFLYLLGRVLWKLGIQPNALEACALGIALAIFGIPSFVYVKKRAEKLLNKASLKLIEIKINQNNKEKVAEKDGAEIV